MYKRILIAVDDSDTSHQALQEAIKLAKDQQAKLRMIHVADEQYINYEGLNIDYDTYSASVRNYGQQLLKKMEVITRESKLDCDTLLIELKAFQGRIEQKIIESADSWDADLLVVGTHGRRGFNHFLLGSVAEGVMRNSHIPVLLIRGKATKTT